MKHAPQDEGLVPEQFVGLNREFYSTESPPHVYIQNRFRAVFLATTESDLVEAAHRAGFNVGELRVQYQGEDARLSQKAANDYLATESTVLLHHAAEAYFRLLLAHRGGPECPWLETARLRDFRKFKEEVEHLAQTLDDPNTQADLMHVSTGHRSHATLPTGGPTEGEWKDNQDAVVRLTGILAHALLAGGNLYNAAKHGLAVIPGEMGVRIGAADDDSGIELSAQGQTLRYLEVVESSGGKIWHRTARWIRPEAQLSLTYLVARQMENIWNVGKLRYVGVPGAVTLHPLALKVVEAAEAAGRTENPIQIEALGEGLVYYAEVPRAPRKRRS